MKKNYTLISSYRKELMGIAIIFIMIAHNTLDTTGAFHIINSGIQLVFQVGVDIFFLLSGYGCYYSMTNDTKKLSFYKKRILRIMPAYIVVVFLYGVYCVFVNKVPINEYLWTYSLISFYTSDILHEWFIAAILLTYLIYPFLHLIINKYERLFKTLILLLYLFFLLYILGVIQLHGVYIAIYITRIPAFLFGMLFSKKAIEGKSINPCFLKISVASGVLVCFAAMIIHHFRLPNSWIIIRTFFVLTVFAIIIIWITIREKYSSSKPIIIFANTLSFMGGYTLELYLFHEKLLDIIEHIFKPDDFSMLLISNTLGIVFAVIFAILLNKMLKSVLKS